MRTLQRVRSSPIFPMTLRLLLRSFPLCPNTGENVRKEQKHALLVELESVGCQVRTFRSTRLSFRCLHPQSPILEDNLAQRNANAKQAVISQVAWELKARFANPVRSQQSRAGLQCLLQWHWQIWFLICCFCPSFGLGRGAAICRLMTF
jgi:hypothetical protein